MPTRAELERRYAGRYVRIVHDAPDRNQASLTLRGAAGGRLAVVGTALWVGTVEGDVHDGEVDGAAFYRYIWAFDNKGGDCRFSMRFEGQVLTVSHYSGSCGGMNVTFDGTYRKGS